MVPYITQHMAHESEFVTIALPRELIEKIDKFVKDNNHMYPKRPNVIKVALHNFFKNNGGDGKDGSID